MAEVTMTMLHVHEIETRSAGHSRGVVEVLDEFTNLAIGDHRIVSRQVEPLVEQRMTIENARPAMAISSRMRELKTDQQAVIISAFTSMFRDQRLAQILDITHCPVVEQKLVGIRSPVLTHGDGFAAPDEFCAARSEMLPTADGQRTGPAIRRPVPAFHGLDRESIADAYVVEFKWLRQGRCIAFCQNRIARNRDPIRA